MHFQFVSFLRFDFAFVGWNSLLDTDLQFGDLGIASQSSRHNHSQKNHSQDNKLHVWKSKNEGGLMKAGERSCDYIFLCFFGNND